ncbi:hypothetical protein LIER_05927 [Lithospermum erythrorhizon]|uniref:Uncharacterized protein n=1 Tax=Lithospermum erythrorhizon TaxID=34254 RepID=A0AAV3P3M5_LITER
MLLPSQAASASRALADGHTALYQHNRVLIEELAQECLKVVALEQELQCLRLQVNNYPWDMDMLDQELKRAQAKMDATDRAALATRREREGLRHAYFQENPLRYHRIGAAVLSDIVLYSQDRSPTLPGLAEEYR